MIWSMVASATAAREARQRVRTACRGQCPPEVSDSLELIASELVGNVYRHGGGEVELRVDVAGDSVLLEVSDPDEGHPRLRCAGADEESGRGLFLVEAVSTAWGVTPRPDGGKSVWAQVVCS